MAFGLENAGKEAINAAVAQIPGLEEFLGDKVAVLHAAGDEIVDRVAAALKADAAPAIEQFGKLNDNLETAIGWLKKLTTDGIPVSVAVSALIGGPKAPTPVVSITPADSQ